MEHVSTKNFCFYIPSENMYLDLYAINATWTVNSFPYENKTINKKQKDSWVRFTDGSCNLKCMIYTCHLVLYAHTRTAPGSQIGILIQLNRITVVLSTATRALAKWFLLNFYKCHRTKRFTSKRSFVFFFSRNIIHLNFFQFPW